MALFGNSSQQGPNPGYGNDANVGYSPGQVGPVPPGWSKFDYQLRQYNEMYGKQHKSLFARYPLTFVALWYPLVIMATVIAFFVASAIISMAWDVNVLFGIVGFVLVGAAFLLFAATALVFWPVMALMMHRRRGGMFSEYFAWTDRLIPHANFDYYENP